MGITRFLLLIISLLLAFQCIEASYKTVIYRAYINSDLVQWKKILDQMDMQKNKSNEFLLELLNYQYGYIAWNVGNDKSKQAQAYLEAGELNIKVLEKKLLQVVNCKFI